MSASITFASSKTIAENNQDISFIAAASIYLFNNDIPGILLHLQCLLKSSVVTRKASKTSHRQLDSFCDST